MPKLAQAQLPFRDRPVNILSLRAWWQMGLGILMLMALVAVIRPVWAAIEARLKPAVAAWPPLLRGQHLERAEDPVVPVVRMLH